MCVYHTPPSIIWSLRPLRRPPPCPDELRTRLKSLGLWCPCRPVGQSSDWRLVPHRGCRAGRRVQEKRTVCLHPVASVSVSPADRVTFACLNVRSLHNKLDDVLEIVRDRHVDIFCLVESWHDSDSICVGRLRSAGFNIVDRPRPRTTDDLSVNHGGVVVFSAADVVMSPIAIVQPSTFELVCVRIVIGHFTAIVVTVYRPGSVAVQQQFFEDLASVLEQIATYQAPIYVVGDFNIRLDRPDDAHSYQLRQLVDCYDLTLHCTAATHQLGGTLDAVITRKDAGRPERVDVIDVGVSDHHLLQWSTTTARPEVVAVVESSRPWRRLDVDQLRAMLSTSSLCQPDTWPADIDEMAAMYDDELNNLLDQLIPSRPITRRPRRSDPWFDADCRAAKRLTRRLERAYSAARRRSYVATVDTSIVHDSTSAATGVSAAKAAWYAQRRVYRQLRHRKCCDFWAEKIETERANPAKLWRSVDSLLGRGRVSASLSIGVEDFNKFFIDKVAKVRSTTSDAPPPTFSQCQAGVSFREFSRISIDDVIAAVRQLPDKSSAADPIPTFVLKKIVDLIAPFVAELYNRSLIAGHFPNRFKEAFITPIVKKPGLDCADVSSYRPISNLSVLSKLLERLVARQLLRFLTSANLLPSLQSGFRPGHSTETAILHVISELLLAVDHGDFAALTLLDLSAAFDTVDHDILIKRLQASFGIDGCALKWFQSYLFGRTQYVRRGATCSLVVHLLCGVPQGSVLGPILFILYTADLVALIRNFGLSPHLYADDTQIYGACSPANVDSFLSNVNQCLSAVADWMNSNRLQLNSDKTEFLWCTTTRRQHRLPVAGPIIGSSSIEPSSSARDLGVFIDSDLSMETQVKRTVSRCFGTLRQLRAIRRQVPTAVFQSLIVALILSRLDYCNSMLVGLPANLIRRLQSVQNAAARLIFGIRRSEHITDALASLHWLRVSERILFKVAVLTYRAVNGTAPVYLSSYFTRVADVPSRLRLRSSNSDQLIVPSFNLTTVGRRAFPVSAANLWNSLPVHPGTIKFPRTYLHTHTGGSPTNSEQHPHSYNT